MNLAKAAGETGNGDEPSAARLSSDDAGVGKTRIDLFVGVLLDDLGGLFSRAHRCRTTNSPRSQGMISPNGRNIRQRRRARRRRQPRAPASLPAPDVLQGLPKWGAK